MNNATSTDMKGKDDELQEVARLLKAHEAGDQAAFNRLRVLELSLRTVQRGGLRARMWLRVALEAPARPAPHLREECGP